MGAISKRMTEGNQYEYTAAGLPRRVPFAELPDVDLRFEPQWPTEDPDAIRDFGHRLINGITRI